MSLVLSEGLNPAIDRVILDRAEYERLHSINAELLKALEDVLDTLDGRSDVVDGSDGYQLPNEAMSILNEHGDHMRAVIERAKA